MWGWLACESGVSGIVNVDFAYAFAGKPAPTIVNRCIEIVLLPNPQAL
jgi:hypothetical protein